MRAITLDQFLVLADVNKSTFKAMTSRGESALAFGTARALAGGTMLDVDAIAWAFLDELTPAFTRQFASVLVRGFSDQWVSAVAKAERLSDPIFLVAIETGEITGGGKMRATRREGINIGEGTLAEIGNALGTAKNIPERITMINVTTLVNRLRSRAKAAGIELGPSFFPDMADPDFQRALAEVKASRDQNVARVERTSP